MEAQEDVVMLDAPAVDPATNTLLLGLPIDLSSNVQDSGDERFTFPDEEPSDFVVRMQDFAEEDDDYFQFSPRHGVIRKKNAAAQGGKQQGKAKFPAGVSPRGMSKEMTLPLPLLRKQLETTVKKLDQVMKEKNMLQERLDKSGMTAELDRLHLIISEQDAAIDVLDKDNKVLQKALRNQSRAIVEHERREQKDRELVTSTQSPDSGNGPVAQLEKQLGIALEKHRKLTMQYNQGRNRERQLVDRCNALKQETSKLRSYIVKLVKTQSSQQAKLAAAAGAGAGTGVTAAAAGAAVKGGKGMQKSPAGLPQLSLQAASHGDGDGSSEEVLLLNQAESGALQWPELTNPAGGPEEGGLGLTEAPEGAEEAAPAAVTETALVRISSNGASENDDDAFPSGSLAAELRMTIVQLQKALATQRTSYQRDIAALRVEVSKYQTAQRALQGDLEEREKEARAHLLTVKKLRNAYEGMAEDHERLLHATDVYGNHALLGHSDSSSAGKLSPRPPSGAKSSVSRPAGKT
jgi:hypothetical protein